MAGKHRAARRRTPGPFPLSNPLPSALRRSPRSWSAIPLSWRTTGGVVVGAAVLGTAAATAQASVLQFDSGTAKTAAEFAVVQDGGDRGSGGSAASDDAGEPGGDDAGAGSGSGSGGGSGDAGSGASGDGGSEEKKKSKPTAQDAIAMAEKQVGIKEDANGETKFNDWYVESERSKKTVERDGGSLAGYSDAAWCSMFISWIGSQIGADDQFGHDAYTVTHAQWFKDEGRWGTEPEPGAIVFFDWGGSSSIDAIDHVGMVIEKIDDGTVKTVEGNTDSAVKIRERSTSTIVGYGYPEYAEK
ncbi:MULTISPECIES: CHAP domain-containing protein [Actinomadura]|uniref:CHAP domain-containing protein n=1 Tax=Actinomadura TaxID=1988 RepID=UPI00068724CC|nr:MULTISPECIES: CHAP domain-containing protein [Actinomadura]RSN59656.1 CHAP domain-containing protein [Actinomadura sp. WAC 06369]